ncbi:ATP/GTP-binding protein [Neptunomonas phycophila]|uniref:GTP-binding protein n=1 Tax=Neptunomonas TaxID=75687 RepID=UPI000948A07E|nr:ATP/GTP-binding protein [Neptunomonas phycophila]
MLLKVVFIGPMGSGKSTAIQTISEIEPVKTEARNTERFKVDKPTTTVGMDYGEINLGEHGKVALYGVPGQQRFDFMWPIITKGAMGAIMLLDCSQENCWKDFKYFVDEFTKYVDPSSFIVALNRATDSDVDHCNQLLMDEGLTMPVFCSDPRNEQDLTVLLHVLISNAELRFLLD